MKAAQISEYGDASVVKVVETAKPVAHDGCIVVEVHAASLNPFDSTVRSGHVQKMMPLTLPVILGGDFAGVVAEIGAGVTGLVVGDKVYGQANAVAGSSGSFAEYAATKANQVAKAPENLSFQQAASLPLVGVSAWQALTDHLKLAAGQKILITGGTGGIGSIAIQMAKYLGAQVAATATGDGIGLARKLGADEVIDYKVQAIDTLKDFDAVFDTVGGETFDKSLRSLQPGGTAVSMAAQPNEALAKELNVTALMQMTRVTTKKLDKLRDLVEAGVVAPQVGQVFSLADIVEAFRAKENGDVKGKVVIAIK